MISSYVIIFYNYYTRGCLRAPRVKSAQSMMVIQSKVDESSEVVMGRLLGREEAMHRAVVIFQLRGEKHYIITMYNI